MRVLRLCKSGHWLNGHFCFNLPARILVDGVEAVVVLIAFRRFAQFPGNERQRARSGKEKGCGYDHDQSLA